ncbi:MAG: UPF0182 family protein [Candidatus Dormibacteraeota bacterium]|nr:UPF0182 family protein [Candidatus Dormibacteraeota bacterium]
MSRRYGRGPFDPFEGRPFEGLGEIRLPRPPRRVWIGLAFIAAAVVIVFVTAPIVGLITENQWFGALGLGPVYRTRVLLQFWLFIVGLVLGLGLSLLNGFIGLRLRSGASLRALGVRRATLRSRAGYVTIAVAALIALIQAGAIGSAWPNLALFLHPQGTGTVEPLYHLDVGFYLLQLPFLHDVVGWLMGLTVLNLLLAAGLHVWRGDTFDLRLPPRALAHLSGLLGILALVLGAGAFLGRYDLLTAHNGAVYGAGYSDVNARTGLALAQAVLAVLLGLALFVNTFLRRGAVMVLTIVVWIAGSLVTGIYPAVVQRFSVQPSELSQESPYIKREIQFTRSAYGLDQAHVDSFGGDSPVTADEVAADSATIDNLRLWDDTQIQETYQQLQSIRTYYTFPQIDLDRYTIGGKLQQVQISGRELDQGRLPPQAQNWVNQRLAYTHGYGVAASPVSVVGGEGLPDYVVGDVPPTGRLPVTRPEIYYGQLTSNYVLAPSVQPEFDYPKGDQNASNAHAVGHGVKLDGANRMLWSLKTGDFNLLISSQITAQTEILYRRNIQQRISAIAPFLQLLDSPYIVVSGGHLYWVQDAYVSSPEYPYSQPLPGDLTVPAGVDPSTNYLRNSVKVVVDAYGGQPTFYVADSHDPMTKAYAATFPTLFHPLSDMSLDLRRHLRLPPTMFTVQADVYGTYHVSDTTVFYQREDVWQLALPSPYYVLLRLPGEAQAEYLQIIPFAPRGKQNLVAWLAVRNDPQHYGQLVSFVLPKDKVVLGPQQVASRINQTPGFSSDKTLLNQQGSSFIEGQLLAVPIGNSFLYFEPIYLRSNTSSTSLPELKRVILTDASGTSPIAYAPSLQEALTQLVGAQVPGPNGPPGTTPSGPSTGPPSTGNQAQIAALVSQANTLYTAAQTALRQGDLATYAQNLQKVGQLLQQIQQLEGASPGAAASPAATASPRASPRASPSR